MRGPGIRIALALAAALAMPALPAVAQVPESESRPRPELRADLLAGGVTAVHAGVGINIPAGYYVRTGVIAAAGTRLSGGGAPSARVDVVSRFLFDPFRERRWGLSAGGGVSLRYDEEVNWRPFLVAVVDLELPAAGRVVPAVQAGVGGGVRIGAALRWRSGPRR